MIFDDNHEIEALALHFIWQETSEKMQVETFVWANKDDPHLYGEWDFEVHFINTILVFFS